MASPQIQTTAKLENDWVLVSSPETIHDDIDCHKNSLLDISPLPALLGTNIDTLISPCGQGVEPIAPACAVLPGDMSRDINFARKRYVSARKEDIHFRQKATISMQNLLNAVIEEAHMRSDGYLKIQTLAQQLAADEDTLSLKFEALLSEENRLSSLERDVMNHEQSAYSPLLGEVSSVEEAVEDDASSEISESPSNTPAVVRDFFRLARLEFVSSERLDELDSEHHLAKSGVIVEDIRPGECSSPQNEDERAYHRSRQAIVTDLAVLRCNLEAQRNVCLAQGHDPERFRYRRLSGLPEAEDDEGCSQNERVNPISKNLETTTRLDSIIDWLGY